MNPENPTGSLPVALPRAGSTAKQSRKPSRRALEAAFTTALYENFDKWGTDFLDNLREKRPDCYLRAVLLLLPKETEKPASATDALGGEDLEALVAGARARLVLYGGVRAATAELAREQSAEEIPALPETS
ncbi:MAG TPA: hypothetical protein VEU06_09130 [Micropepsaceae bacterium]|nr:hypothetical protein [Micropepsaceae bacterium]